MKKTLLTFVLFWVAAPSWAALTLSPVVDGYSAGAYRAAAGAYTMAAANEGFVAPAVVNVAGKAVTMSATMRMAANAGSFAKSAMRLSPLSIAGTLAAGWLFDQGISWLQAQQQWVKTPPADAQGGSVSSTDSPWLCGGVQMTPAQCAIQGGWDLTAYPIGTGTITQLSPDVVAQFTCGGYTCAVVKRPAGYVAAPVPMAPGDWDALPDPSPVVAPELPNAPYMPNGAPVQAPEYQPQDVPIGNPYSLPDGSTVQDHAKITPGTNGQVTIVTYQQQVTDSAGNPVSNPTKTTTPDQPDFCASHPDSVACMSSGGPPTFTPPPDAGAPADPSIVAAGGAIDWHHVYLSESATCALVDIPYDAMGQHFSIPLSQLCQYLPILKSVIIFLASIVSIRMFALAPW